MNLALLAYLRDFADHCRTDVYAVKTETAYRPVAEKIIPLVIERHVSGNAPIGVYPVMGDRVRLASFDLDDHDGDIGWPRMAEIARTLITGAGRIGLQAHPWRSGGGAGIHLHFLFETEQKARDIRYALRAILAEAGLSDGTGGVAAGAVEVFPRQDSVAPGALGNLIALPAARQSLPLREESLDPYSVEELDVPALTMRISRAVEAAPTDERRHGSGPSLDTDPEEARASLRSVPSDDWDAWVRVGLALKHSLGEDGYEVFREWSAKSAKFDERDCRRRWDGMRPNGDVGLGTIFHLGREHGWNGPADAFVREMNGRFGILTYGSTTLIIPKNGDRRPEDDFIGLSKPTFLDRMVPETIVRASEGGGIERLSKGKTWLAHPKATHYHRLDFDPSLPPGHNGLTWNLWTGFAVEPAPGDWSLLRNHIRENIARGDEDKANWLINWMALGVQHPAELIGTAPVLIGFPGTGKGVLAHAYGRLWGPHYLAVTHAEHVSGRFTGHFAGRRFVFIDEGTFGGNRREAGNLKTRVTEPTIILERKGVDAIRMTNRMIFMLASNEPSVVPADKGDRRWMVFDVGDERREDHAYFAAIHQQLAAGGYEGMLHDLLRRDIGGGPNPRRIIRNEALFEQVLLAQGPEVRYLHHLLENGRLPQNWVVGASSTTIKALLIDMRREHPEAGYFNDMRLGRFLNRVFPELKTVQGGTYHSYASDGPTVKERSTRYDFPSLPRARKAFEQYLRMPVPWGEVTEWQLDPRDEYDENYPV